MFQSIILLFKSFHLNVSQISSLKEHEKTTKFSESFFIFSKQIKNQTEFADKLIKFDKILSINIQI